MFKPSQKAFADENSYSMLVDACGLYFSLSRMMAATAGAGSAEEMNLGGRLLYAGELDDRGRALLVAGNVAGCASLAATADAAGQKQSIRDGVADFLVSSLDEALRILKNEVRQRKTVAVCVGMAAGAVELEMIERGVQPDLVFAGRRRAGTSFGPGTHEILLAEREADEVFLAWQVEQAPAQWLPRLDAVALGCVDAGSWEARWIKLAPRYLGRSASTQRALCCDRRVATEIVRRFSDSVRNGEIAVEVSVRLASGDEASVFRMKPDQGSQ